MLPDGSPIFDAPKADDLRADDLEGHAFAQACLCDRASDGGGLDTEALGDRARGQASANVAHNPTHR
jgi:hypothetical protein